jgi:dipeptidyl aminopeptidase/acylaminoacyl peptidase
MRLGQVVLACTLFLVIGIETAGCDRRAPAERARPNLVIPAPVNGPRRAITTLDLLKLRDIDSFALAPDGAHFAILVRQADLKANAYNTAWFVGDTSKASLVYVGNGGEARHYVDNVGTEGGEIVGSRPLWSPNSGAIAYTARRSGQTQVWLSSIRGEQRQLTHNAADVREYFWSRDGSRLFFTVGMPRSEEARELEAARRSGFSWSSFLWFGEVVWPQIPPRPLKALTIWLVDATSGVEHRATPAEQREFAVAKAHAFAWSRDFANSDLGLSNSDAPAIVRSDGLRAKLAHVSDQDKGVLPGLRIVAVSKGGAQLPCRHDECVGQRFEKVWWDHKGNLVFWRKEPLGHDAFYSWDTSTGALQEVYRSGNDFFSECDLSQESIYCLRETRSQPMHVARIDIGSGRVALVADVNPEFGRILLGRTERIEWSTPQYSWTSPRGQLNGVYPSRAFGYVIYPSDYNPSKAYPVIIAPYSAAGFPRGDVGDEQPLLVYAAAGFIVLNTNFPPPLGANKSWDSKTLMNVLYSKDLGFPHMTMLLDSTLCALDLLERKVRVNETEVGMGGLSHGALITLFALQRYDRVAVASVSSPVWNQLQVFETSAGGRDMLAKVGGEVDWPEDSSFWAGLDPADHISAIHAPILFQLADRELFGALRLIKHLNDAHKPSDTYIFNHEFHEKWQPAHRLAIYNRNLDWFRFWLQGYESADPSKAAQYATWKRLLAYQCRDTASLVRRCQ